MKSANIVMLPVNKIEPHPKNPRMDLGDLSELKASIELKGILQNLTVVEGENGGYIAVIGHRRLAAAKQAGIDEVPCAIVELDEGEQLATMLLENMQRSDLTVYEQAEGMQQLLSLEFSVEDIAQKTGFSESTVYRRIRLLCLDKEKFKASTVRQVNLYDYEKLCEIKDEGERNELLEHIGTNNFNNKIKAAIDRQKCKEQKKAVTDLLMESGVEILPHTTNTFSMGYAFDNVYYFGPSFNENKINIKENKKYVAKIYDWGFQLYRKKEEQPKKESAADKAAAEKSTSRSCSERKLTRLTRE